MTNQKRRRLFLVAVLTAIAGLQSGMVSAAKPGGGGKPGDCWEWPPASAFPDRDLSNEIGFYISTAVATIRNGILVSTSATTLPAYSNGSVWISSSSYGTSNTLWNIGISEAFKRDFTNYYPTNRAWLTFHPNGSVKTGYLAAYNSKGRLMKQLTFTSASTTVLDTSYLSGRIGYVLASFDAPGGQLGTTGDCIRWR